MNYTKGTKLIRVRTQVYEIIIVGLCKMKVNEQWIDGVIYEGNDINTGKHTMFVKPKEDFDKEFILS